MSVRFEKVDLPENFYFISFEQLEIEKKYFLKINILDKSSNTVIVIYEKSDDDLYDTLADLKDFQNIDDKIYENLLKWQIKICFS